MNPEWTWRFKLKQGSRLPRGLRKLIIGDRVDHPYYVFNAVLKARRSYTQELLDGRDFGKIFTKVTKYHDRKFSHFNHRVITEGDPCSITRRHTSITFEMIGFN